MRDCICHGALCIVKHPGKTSWVTVSTTMERIVLGKRPPRTFGGRHALLMQEEDTQAEVRASMDNISPEASLNIVRSMSSRPGSKNWMPYLCFDDVQNLYLGKGYISDLCRQHITRISTKVGVGSNRMFIGRYLTCYRNLSQGGGHCMRSLVLRCNGSSAFDPADILIRCTELRDLDVSEVHPSFVEFGNLF